MTDIRTKLEALITDSGSYRQGQQDERERLCKLIDIRVDELHAAPSLKNRLELCSELLRFRQYLNP